MSKSTSLSTHNTFDRAMQQQNDMCMYVEVQNEAHFRIMRSNKTFTQLVVTYCFVVSCHIRLEFKF